MAEEPTDLDKVREGKSIAEAAEGDGVEDIIDEDVIPEAPPLVADSQMSFNIGGRRTTPKSSKVKLMGVGIPATGTFHPDETVDLLVRARVHKIEHVPDRDKDGLTTGWETLTYMRPLSVERYPATADQNAA